MADCCGGIASAIEGLASAFTNIENRLTAIETRLSSLELDNETLDAIKVDTQFIKDNLGDVDLTAIEEKLVDIVRDLGEILSWSIPDKIAGLGTLINNIKGFIQDYFDWLRGFVQGLWDKFFGGGDDSDLTEILRKIDTVGGEILKAIERIPTNDAERILNAMTGLEQILRAHSGDLAEIIRRLAEGFDGEILKAIERIPTNDAERILNAMTGLEQILRGHSGDLAEIIRRLAEGFDVDFTEVLNAIGDTKNTVNDRASGIENTVRNETGKVLTALAALALADLINSILQGIKDALSRDMGGILSALRDIVGLIQDLRGDKNDEPIDFSEVLNAINRIPTNDAERVLNGLTGITQTLGRQGDQQSEIIRRLAEGVNVDFSELLTAIDRIPLNDADRILLALSPITQTQASHSNSLAEIIRRLAEGLEFDDSKLDAIIAAIIQLGVGVSRIPLNDADRILLALSPIEETQAHHTDKLNEIIRRLAEGFDNDESKLDAIIRTLIQLAVAIDRIPLNDAERVLNALNGLDGRWSPLFSEMIQRLVDLAELFEYYDNLQWQPTKELAQDIWGEFEDDLSVTVDLSGNCSDSSDLEEYKNPGMKGVERMLQGLAAKLEIMEINAGKSNYPIVYQPPTPEPTAANPEPETPEPVEFCSPPDAVSYLFELINQLAEKLKDLDKINKKLGSAKFKRPLALSDGDVTLYSRQDFVLWACNQLHYLDVNFGTETQCNYLPDGAYAYLLNYPVIDGKRLTFRVPANINTLIDTANPNTFLIISTRNGFFEWAARQIELFPETRFMTKVRGLPSQNPDTITDDTEKAVAPRSITGDPIELPDMTEYFAWNERQFEEILGGWGKEITLLDTDLAEEGNQTTKVVFPNMSEAIVELVQTSMQSLINIEALMQIASRSLIEAGSAKIEAIKAGRYGEAIAEYIGFAQQDQMIDIPMTFSPPVNEGDGGKLEDFNRISNFLTPVTTKIPVVDNIDPVPFSDSLQKLLHAAAVIRSVYWQEANLDNMGDTMRALATRAANFPDAGKLTDALLRGTGGNTPEEGDGEGTDDFDIWLDRVERGFVDEAGITDPTNPYGRDYERRPRIRKIGESGAK